MSDKFTIALLTVAVTAFGWLVAYFLARRREDRTRRLENGMRRYEGQIGEFYGQIFGLIHQLNNFNRIQQLIVGTAEENDGHLTDEEVSQVYSYFSERYFLPLHLEINEILKKKLYLINPTTIPDSFYAYLRHATQLFAQKGLWEEKGVDSSHLRGVDFPDEFLNDIKHGLDSAMKNYERCLRSLEIEG